jgi:hypothetical protein
MVTAPIEVLLSFPKPNYIDPETHGPGLMIVATLLSIIAIGVVALRLYARFVITKAPGVDDILIVGALIFGIGLSVIVMVGNQIYYNGYHVWVNQLLLCLPIRIDVFQDIPPRTYVGHRINVWVAQILYTLALACVKISILLFYRRLSVSFSRSFIIAVWIGIIYNILYAIGFVMTLLLLCQPVSAYWMSFDKTYKAAGNYHCGSEQIAEPASAVFSVIGDIYSTVLPLVLVSRLTLPKKQKMALYGLFSLGFSVVLFGAIRTVYMYRVVNVDYDFTWTLWKIWVWGEFELWFAVYAASAPALKPFFKKYIGKITSSSGGSKSHKQVYLVRSDGNGGLGKVERIFVSNKRKSDAYHEISPDRAKKTDDFASSMSDSQILKSVAVDVEAFDVEALPSPCAGPSYPMAPMAYRGGFKHTRV